MTGVKSTMGRAGRGKSISADDEAYIIRRYNEGAFMRQIAKEIGRSVVPVKRVLKGVFNESINAAEMASGKAQANTASYDAASMAQTQKIKGVP